MKRFIIFSMIASFIIAVGLKDLSAAGVVSSNAPTFNSVDAGGPIDTSLNSAFNTSWSTFLSTVDQTIKENWNSQNKLAKGLGNANAFSSQAANLDGYQGYDLFALMVGFGIGAQYPSDLKDITKSGNAISQDIEKNGDVYAGIGVGAAVNLGINAKLIGLNHFYFNVKMGQYTYNATANGNDIKAKVSTFGVGVNYQFVTQKNLLASMIKWRGISLGSGFLYNSNQLDLTVQGLSNITQPISNGYSMVLSPDIKLGWDAKTYTIPFDINTSLRLLWIFNVNVGAGVDLIFGSTNINIGQTSYVTVTGPSGNITNTPGKVVIDASTKNVAPSFIRPRVQAGVGLALGPLTAINAQFTYYIPDGAYVGLSAGIVW